MIPNQPNNLTKAYVMSMDGLVAILELKDVAGNIVQQQSFTKAQLTAQIDNENQRHTSALVDLNALIALFPAQ